jgi:uncharacterized OB-fold protein
VTAEPTVPLPGTAPRDDAFSRPFWHALGEGRLTTTRCSDCGRLQFPPRVVCVHCWGRAFVWEELSGSGRLAAYTEVHAGPSVFAAELPYTLGLVDLDEQLRLLARITAGFDELTIGQHVLLRRADRDGIPLLTFRPAPSTEATAERTPRP